MKLSKAHDNIILIVDDEPKNVQVVGSTLSAFGYDFMIAKNAEEALRRIEAKVPDLVLLDINMPGMDGFELCAEFRKRDDMDEVPIIFLSAENDKNLVVKALESGGVDYVTKPFNKAELLARVRTHVELKRMRDESAELVANTERFLEIMAHDLKNWIGSANFGASLLADREDLPEKVETLSETILDSTGQALAFIEEFLENAREAQTELVLKPQTFDLGVLFEELKVQLIPRAREKNIALHVTSVEEGREVRTDRTALRRVLENLLTNAVKFSPRDSRVDLVVSRELPLQIRVSDEGPGFSEEDRGKLFEPYQRLSAKPTAGEVSTGLGLSIVRKLCDQLGVNLEIEDSETGAHWLLTFPS